MAAHTAGWITKENMEKEAKLRIISVLPKSGGGQTADMGPILARGLLVEQMAAVVRTEYGCGLHQKGVLYI